MKRQSKAQEAAPEANASKAFAELRSQLVGSLVEREGEVDALLLALVAQEHVLYVGPPGTAKSMLATSLTKAIDSARCFSVLMTKFTTPEEVFGPIKLTALKEDRYERAVEGYAADSHVLFLDEIWKASSAILNTNLTLLQERVFDNGGTRTRVPLRVAVAASNEFPSSEEGQELGAMFDRFLIRRIVRPVSHQGRERLAFGTLPGIKPCVSLREVDAAAQQASGVAFSDAARGTFFNILDQLGAAGIRPGDRRTRKAVGVARAQAWLLGDSEVKSEHLECLQDVLWSSPEQRDKCGEIVVKLANPVGAQLNEILKEVDEILSKVADTATRIGAIKKLEDCLGRVQQMGGNGRAKKVERHIREMVIVQTNIACGMDEKKAKTHAAMVMES